MLASPGLRFNPLEWGRPVHGPETHRITLEARFVETVSASEDSSFIHLGKGKYGARVIRYASVWARLPTHRRADKTQKAHLPKRSEDVPGKCLRPRSRCSGTPEANTNPLQALGLFLEVLNQSHLSCAFD